MIEIETRQLTGQHLLHAFPGGKNNTPLPVIVFYHGFTSSALVYSYFAVALAQAGFRVIMPDAPEHAHVLTAMRRQECLASGKSCSKTWKSLRRYVRLSTRRAGYSMTGSRSPERQWAA